MKKTNPVNKPTKSKATYTLTFMSLATMEGQTFVGETFGGVTIALLEHLGATYGDVIGDARLFDALNQLCDGRDQVTFSDFSTPGENFLVRLTIHGAEPVKETRVVARWGIALCCECPRCARSIDLLSIPDFLDGRTLAFGETGTDLSDNLGVWCFSCGLSFIVKCER